MSNNIKLEFEITPILIDVNAILVQNAEYKYTGSELGLRVFEDLTPEIKKYLNYRLTYIDSEYVYEGVDEDYLMNKQEEKEFHLPLKSPYYKVRAKAFC